MNRGAQALVACTVAVAGLCCAAAPAASFTGAERSLIRTYSPIVNLREQTDPPCDTSEEQFEPTTVDVVLGNPEVVLERAEPRGNLKQVRTAPTATEVAGLGEDYYLQLPGDPLNAGCIYAKDFSALKKRGEAPAVTYAHIAREPGQTGLAVQYWFFYYFNQFNDLHEGDWEGMQLTFEASDPAQALADGPDRIALFQHAGGEKADWDDQKVQKEGTHPVVYPAAGSHATFYDSAVYVENGQGGSGLGCDNTSDPLRAVRPEPVPIPTEPRRGSRFAWLDYYGHWGQREAGFNNGPQGPQTKRQWRQPFAWMDGVRSTSPRLPGGALAGPAVTGAFCGAVATASDLLNLESQSRPAVVLIGIAALLLVVIPALLTTWRPVELDPLRQRRAFGQLVRAARRLYGRHWRALVPIGLTALVVLGAIDGLAWLLGEVVGSPEVEGRAGLSGVTTALQDLITFLGNPVGYAIVAGAVIAFLRLLEQGAANGFRAAYETMLERFWRVVGAQLLVNFLCLLMLITVIGIPIAIKKYIDWQFVQQEILFRDRGVREAMRASSGLVRGRWWWTVRVAGFFWLVSVVAGPVLGFFLIFANLSLLLINVIGSIVFALLIPYVATGRTLLYLDLALREPYARPHRLRRMWARLRPSPQPG